MKNKLLPTVFLFSLFCLFFNSVQAQKTQKESDVKKLQLKGKVKTLEVFDSSGLKELYVFNEAGDITEQSQIYKSDNKIYNKVVNSYDRSGNKTGAEYFHEGELKTKTSFKSDEKGNLIEQSEYDWNGSLISKTVNKYDAQGKLLETVRNQIKPIIGEFLMFGFPGGEYKELFTYDENGNLKTKQSFFPITSIPFDNRSFRFNLENQKIEETETTQTYEKKPPRIFKHFYVYNKQGDVSERRQFEPVKESNTEEVKERFKIIDDQGTVQNGLLISDKPFMILWEIEICSYEYDAENNWTKKNCKGKMRETKDFVTNDSQTSPRVITYF